MLKLLVSIALVLAVLSITGCCCCSGSGYSGYYSTVSHEQTDPCCAFDTPCDCSSSAPDGSCACGE
ncbi:MAG TPA: hypothetical protein VMC84_06025 [Methanocella sp.]|uniref:hypothetical protein n=1 Tax=Methanocella sp. TaxID=2052833 RepID=UPI002CE12BD9|nr:hypothetical protein [Methanocella sp.]HTY90719.1 hypothetical protein [Methanocella sp.]